MGGLWGLLENAGGADRLKSLLEQLDDNLIADSIETDEAGRTWGVSSVTQDIDDLLDLDLAPGGRSSLELRDPNVTVAVGTLNPGNTPGAAAGDPDAGWRVIITTPIAAFRDHGLYGAKLDGQGQLVPHPDHPEVYFVVPQLRVRILKLASGSVKVKILSSASAAGGGTADIYEGIAMEPPHALWGPESAIGFAYRTAVLDLSGEAAPGGLPPDARVQPDEWQGFFFPEVRLFVAPGLDGLAFSAGVRNLWVGIGEHRGITGLFDAEIVDRGAAPQIHVSFRADGRYIADPGPGVAQLPEKSTIQVDTAGGLAPIDIQIMLPGNVTVSDDRAEVTTPDTGEVQITVIADDAGSSGPAARIVRVTRDPAATGGGAPAGTRTDVTGTADGGHRIVKVSESETTVTLALEPPADAMWTVPGQNAPAPQPAPSVTVPVAVGQPASVTATLTAPAVRAAGCWFLFNQPPELHYEKERVDWAATESNMRDRPALNDKQHVVSSLTFEQAMAARLPEIGAKTPIEVDGYASWEQPGSADQDLRNKVLSQHRLDAAKRALERAGFTKVTAHDAFGSSIADPETHPPVSDKGNVQSQLDDLAAPPAPGASFWWLAVARWTAAAPIATCTAQVTRTQITTQTEDPKPADPARPDCFRKIGARVEIVRDALVRAEIYGEFDVETAAESSLQRRGQGPLRSSQRNKNDGICLFLVRLRLSEDRAAWDVTAEFRAIEADRDGLALMTEDDANQAVLNILGALAVTAPLTATVADMSPESGGIVTLGGVALGASDVLHTHALMLRGGELVVSNGVLGADGITAEKDSGRQFSVLLDVEIAFSFDVGIVKVDPKKPLTARYKAVGIRSRWDTDDFGGTVEYVPLPVFAPNRGYALDVPTGALTASPPLDEILRILGFRVSRDNPVYLEVDVGLGLDLGIVTVDQVRVRVRLDGELDAYPTKLRATIDLPGTLHGTGSVEITENGFGGAFDLTVVPTNLRIAATLTFRRDAATGVSGVLVGGRVEFPVPILLGNSGLGIYGFMGGIGVNHRRKDPPTDSLTPALVWVKNQYAGDGVMDKDGWVLDQGSFAFAAGVALGTVDAGFTVHLDGIVLIEIPGPRLLLIMKADVLSLPPAFGSQQSATFLAVLEIDFDKGSILIGIVAEYEIKSILKVRVPVTASFNTDDPEKWFVDLGRRDPESERVSVTVLDVIHGSGYLMVHGDGIELQTSPELKVERGFAVATGFHIQAVLMGSKSAGLYLEVAAGFDAVLGIDPFALQGIIYARGELRLWIVSIGASAKLTVKVGSHKEPDGTVVQHPYVEGEVCGKVDFFFFSVKGCVRLKLGAPPPATPEPRDLVSGIALIARTSARLEGTGAGEVIDGKLGDAAATDDADAVPPVVPPVVPIDAIPIVSFHAVPGMTKNDGTPIEILDAAPTNVPLGGSNGWTRIGDRWWRYRVTGITVTKVAPGGGATFGPGATPATWIEPAADAGPHAGADLALLSWSPTATPNAVPYGESLVKTVTKIWGSVCDDAAPPAHVLWTFSDSPNGPSDDGWLLVGVAWPDDPDTVRSNPADTRVQVSEPWRIAPRVDQAQGTTPAAVIGDVAACFDAHGPGVSPEEPFDVWSVSGPGTFSAGVLDDAVSLSELTTYLEAGGSLHDLAADAQTTGWEPSDEFGNPSDLLTPGGADLGPGCRGAVLRSPSHDEDTPAPQGGPSDRQLVETAWELTGFRPHELGDAVAFARDGDGFTAFAALMLVEERDLRGDLIVRCEGADGDPLKDRPVTADDIVGPNHTLPLEWVDPGRPWAAPVWQAGMIAARLLHDDDKDISRLAVFVEIPDVPDGTARIVIGRHRPGPRELPHPPFYIVAATGAFVSEAARFGWDHQYTDMKRTALSNTLSATDDDHALLQPGTTYDIAVSWEATSKEADDRPAPTDAGTGWVSVDAPQTFRFKTDTKAPELLAPWIRTTVPAMDETGVFTREHVRIVFATERVPSLFDAYGRELQVIVRAASGHHPEPPGGGAPAGAFTIPVIAGGAFAKLTGAGPVLSAWETAVHQVIDESGLGCIPPGADKDVYELDIPYDFEPLTDYLVDIRSVDKIGATEPILVHRIGFTTSGLRDTAHLAALTGNAVIEHRAVSAPAALAALSDQPSGPEIDNALQATGLDPEPLPARPRTRVLWSTDAVPQPVAIVVESPEPLWRSRPVPTWVEAPADSVDPLHGYWADRPADWLELAADTRPAPAEPPGANVLRIIRGPGGTRAIALLAPGSRGNQARFVFVEHDVTTAPATDEVTTAVRVDLPRAPWEVED